MSVLEHREMARRQGKSESGNLMAGVMQTKPCDVQIGHNITRQIPAADPSFRLSP